MAETSLYVTDEPSPVLTDTCVLEIKKKYDVIPTIVCSICLSIGLVYCFLGYRCFKMVMFLSGFMLGSATVCLLYQKEPVLNTELGLETKAGICLGVGVLCGLVTMLLCTLGLLITGLQLGCLLSSTCLLVIGQFHSLAPWWVSLTALLTTSVIFAVFTLRWQKLFTIFSTAVFGGTAVTLSVDYLVEAFTLISQVYDIFSEAPVRPLCWFNWAVMGIFPTLCLVGVLVQWKFTATGESHTEAKIRKKQKKAKALTYRPSRRPETHRRRKPPPLKRYAGDVLAPSYLQSLQERRMGTGSSTSSVSTIAHTMIDFDFETGSMVPLTASSPGCRL